MPITNLKERLYTSAFFHASEVVDSLLKRLPLHHLPPPMVKVRLVIVVVETLVCIPNPHPRSERLVEASEIRALGVSTRDAIGVYPAIAKYTMFG
jgi:hypothetical protein